MGVSIILIILFIILMILLFSNQKNNNVQTSSEHFNQNFNQNFNKFDAQYTYNKTQELPKDFVVVDVETTGLYPSDCEIIQISAIKYTNLKKVDQFDSYVHPGVKIPEEITKLTGIADWTVANAPDFNQIATSFIDFIGDHILVAHNSDFDMSFIQTQLYYYRNMTIENKVVDTLSLSRKYMKGLMNHKLCTIKDFFGIDLQMHNSLNDCMVTAQLYIYCRKQAKRDDNQRMPLPEMSDNEQLYYNKVIDILKRNGKKLNKVYVNKTNVYFDINYKIKNSFCRICRLKLSGKLKYFLLDLKLQNFEIGDLEVVKGSKSESGQERVMLNKPDDIDMLESIILKNYEHCIWVERLERNTNDYIVVE